MYNLDLEAILNPKNRVTKSQVIGSILDVANYMQLDLDNVNGFIELCNKFNINKNNFYNRNEYRGIFIDKVKRYNWEYKNDDEDIDVFLNKNNINDLHKNFNYSQKFNLLNFLKYKNLNGSTIISETNEFIDNLNKEYQYKDKFINEIEQVCKNII